MKQSMNRFFKSVWKWTKISVIVILIGAGSWYGYKYYKAQHTTTVVNEVEKTSDEYFTQEYKDKKLREIENRPAFKQEVQDEKEKIFYKELQSEATEKLKVLDEKGFTGKTVSMLTGYLKLTNPSLAKYSADIVKLPRWVDTIAIIGHETQFCTTGVGKSKNNCGAVKMPSATVVALRNKGLISKESDEFKTFDNPYDSIVAVSKTISTNYKGKTIAQMNGTYCVDSTQQGNKCPGWTEHINQLALAITSKLR